MTKPKRPAAAPRRIVSNPRIFGGKPVVEGTRMSVEQILGFIAKGMSVAAITRSYPMLTSADIRTAVAYARDSLRNEVVIDVTAS